MTHLVQAIVGSVGVCPARVAPSLAFAMALLGSGCSGEAKESSSAIVTDSAGVRLVEYPSIPVDADEWNVSEIPYRTIGAVSGAEAEAFSRLTLEGRSQPTVVELPSGNIVVADLLSREIRAFSVEGEHIWTAGSDGDGPGELRGITALFAHGDSIIVEDGLRGNLLVFDGDGIYQHAIELEDDTIDGALSVSGVLDNSLMVAAGSVNRLLTAGYMRDTLALHLFETDGSLRRRKIGAVRGAERIVRMQDGHVRGVSVPPMSKGGLIAARGNRIAASDQDTLAVTIYDEKGRLTARTRIPVDAIPVSDALREQYISLRLRTLEGRVSPGEYRSRLENTKFPATLPSSGRLLIDETSHVWLQEYPRPGASSVRWWVIDPNGFAVAFAHLPADLVVQQIESDHIIAVIHDEFQVPFVKAYRLNR